MTGTAYRKPTLDESTVGSQKRRNYTGEVQGDCPMDIIYLLIETRTLGLAPRDLLLHALELKPNFSEHETNTLHSEIPIVDS